MNNFILAVKVVVLIIVVLIWTVVGFLIWIPFLTRMMLAFVAAIITSVYTRKDPTNAQRGLEMAIGFYSKGFQTIMQSMSGKLPQGEFVSGDISLFTVVVELVLAIMFWMGLTAGWLMSVHLGYVRWSEFRAPISEKHAVDAVITTPKIENVIPAVSTTIRNTYNPDREELKWCVENEVRCKESKPLVFTAWCIQNGSGEYQIKQGCDKDLIWCKSFPDYCKLARRNIFDELCKLVTFRRGLPTKVSCD